MINGRNDAVFVSALTDVNKMKQFSVASYLNFGNRDLKQDHAFNTTWPPVLSIDKCCQVTSLSIERTDHHVLLKASPCLSVSNV